MNWDVRLFDFVDRFDRAADLGAISDQFRNLIAEFGFHAFVLASIPTPGRNIRSLMIANGWPPEWAAAYEREKLIEVDPVARQFTRSARPFAWSEVRYDPVENSRGHEVMLRARDFRMHEGLCVPLHGTMISAGVSMAGERIEMDPHGKAALQFLATYAHDRAFQLLHPNRPQEPILSEREQEVLRWAAVGKSNHQIAEILGITERTVKFHVTSSIQKLGTANRTSAVIRAMQLHEILL